jgi:histidinol dehydrogenase
MIIKDFQKLKSRISEVASRVDLNDQKIESIKSQVQEILTIVRKEKLAGIKRLTEKFDKKKIDNFKVSCKGCFDKLDPEVQKALQLAAKRIRRFQEVCLPKKYELIDGEDKLEIRFTPLDSVGVYVPGGTAPLVSTLLMTVIPAQVAGVQRIVVISPPNIHLGIHPGILGAADLLGIEEIYQIGGAQGSGALAYGIEEIDLEPVDKIVGPGNLYVTLAKKEVYGIVGIDALYGPSELLIIADENANPISIVNDLMGQLEHGSGFEATCLLTNSQELAEKVIKEFDAILQTQPKKEAIAKAWNQFGIIGVVEKLEECAELSNVFAPEHLEIKVKEYDKLLPLIKHAGAIFLGGSNEALGDYLAGPSHCLPTGRSARFSSGLSVMDFLKRSSLVNMKATKELIEATAILARVEGLEAHAKSAESVGL